MHIDDEYLWTWNISGWLEGSDTSGIKLGRTGDDDDDVLVTDVDLSEQLHVFIVLLIYG